MRIGVDLGGTKTEAIVLADDGAEIARRRIATPAAYAPCIAAIVNLVRELDTELGARCSVGVGTPGSRSPRDGRMRNANSQWLNGERFEVDLAAALGRPVRIANDANCLALSEAVDGAGAGHRVVFAAILGTGCGGGIALDQRVHEGHNQIAGEWGHTPLPWPQATDLPLPRCWCGRLGCMETFVSGSGFARDHREHTKRDWSALRIVSEAANDAAAMAALERYVDRLARGLAVICDLLDPDVIVLGGGVSRVTALYTQLPAVLAPHLFSDIGTTPILAAAHGDSSGVRGAAWLWPRGT